jgi:hypothetical protein
MSRCGVWYGAVVLKGELRLRWWARDGVGRGGESKRNSEQRVECEGTIVSKCIASGRRGESDSGRGGGG